METNERGEVALKYYQPQNKYVRVGGEKYYREYLFVVGRAGISMAWIQPQDVEEVLKIIGGCCGGGGPVFRYANAGDVRIWTGVAER
jgi:hypothetical protein